MRYKVTTETGSFYFIDTEAGQWSKNHRSYYSRLSQLAVGDYEDRSVNAFRSTGSWKDTSVPEEGKCMAIRSGIHDFYVTTLVVEVAEDPEDWPEEGLLARVEKEIYGVTYEDH